MKTHLIVATHRHGDSTLCKLRVGILKPGFGQHDDLPMGSELDSGTNTGNASPNDDEIRIPHSFSYDFVPPLYEPLIILDGEKALRSMIAKSFPALEKMKKGAQLHGSIDNS
jgi:hypothetical protein